MDRLAATARRLLDEIAYMTVATVDADGTPRASPVYFTPHGYTDLYWVSRPDAQHSRNIARDGRVRAVVFDSTIPVGLADAVYLDGQAAPVPEHELAAASTVAFDSTRGGSAFTPEELSGGSPLRLYRLRVNAAEILVRAGHPTHGDGRDRRVAVTLG